MKSKVLRLATLSFILSIFLCCISSCTPDPAATPTQPPPSPPPTQPTDFHLRIEFTSTSGWADLKVLNPEHILSVDLESVTGNPSNYDVTSAGLVVDQPPSAAENGDIVGITADYVIDPTAIGQTLNFQLQRGNLNGCMARIYRLVGEETHLILEVENLGEIGTDDKNTLAFSLDLNTMVQASSESLTSVSTAPPSEVASIIFHNGKVVTIDEKNNVVEALAIKEDKILAVGKENEILALQGANTITIDLQGKTLMPGFIDPHSHWFNNPWRDDFERGQELLLSFGITTTAELFVEEALIKDMQAFDREGKLRVRVSLYPVHVDNCGSIRGDWYVPNYPVSLEPGAMLQIPGVKMFNDGGTCNAHAVSFQFVGGLGNGDLYFQAGKLSEMIIAVQNSGYQVAIHSIGDRAVDTSLDAFEIVLDGGPNIHHHRIEHNSYIRDDMLNRYSEVDIVALISGRFPTCRVIGSPTPFTYWAPDEYLDWLWRFGPLVRANPDTHFAWHSDAPYRGDPTPMTHLHGFVTRKELGDDGIMCEPPDWAADDALPVEQVLPMMTIEAAYALLREDELGSLETGKLADLIILSDNPLAVASDALLDIQVFMTMVGGNTEYCKPGQEGYCP